MVLFLDCVADVDEFAVFEDQEVVSLREGLEGAQSSRGEVC